MGDKRAAMFGGVVKGYQYLNDLLIVELQRQSVVSVKRLKELKPGISLLFFFPALEQDQ